MVCHDERPDEVIQVAYRPLPGKEDLFPGISMHVRYCRDRAACTEQAIASGPWLGSYK